ncbi:MAG: hypothetical protein F7C08_03995 [Desulfurococcales archaeon]|nr:hypothetical protein [Desulfurococcales archaeon]MCE4605675.1 hypothetical protein [Desulfurococcales archaeon]
MVKGRICARCGRSVDRVIRGLCSSCFAEVYGVAKLPNQVNLVICRYCGSIRVKGVWSRGVEDSIEDTIRDVMFTILTEKLRPVEGLDYAWIDNVKIIPELHGPGIYSIIATIKGESEDVGISEDRVIRLKLDVGVCPACTNKITKRGYNAIVQVRSSSGKLSEEQRRGLERVLARLDPGIRSSIISIEEGRNGIDLLVDEISSARIIASKISSEMLGKTVEAYKLVGRRSDGKRKGRLTISVRLPDVKSGDVIRIGTKRYLIFGLGRGGLIAFNMEKGIEETIGTEDLWGRGFEHDQGVLSAKLLLVYKGNDTVLFTDPSRPEALVEYPISHVRTMVDGLREGFLYKVIRYGKLIYVIEELGMGVQENG